MNSGYLTMSWPTKLGQLRRTRLYSAVRMGLAQLLHSKNDKGPSR